MLNITELRNIIVKIGLEIYILSTDDNGNLITIYHKLTSDLLEPPKLHSYRPSFATDKQMHKFTVWHHQTQ